MNETSETAYKVWLAVEHHEPNGNGKSLDNRVLLRCCTTPREAKAVVNDIASSYRHFRSMDKPFTVVGYFQDNMQPFVRTIDAASPAAAVQEARTKENWRYELGDLDRDEANYLVFTCDPNAPEPVYAPVCVVAVFGGYHQSLDLE
ncbi:hypothetical protein OAS39_09060 [Pirellulales bacterium]|nr:hypothetical protein [Pirellulales bacterium]